MIRILRENIKYSHDLVSIGLILSMTTNQVLYDELVGANTFPQENPSRERFSCSIISMGDQPGGNVLCAVNIPVVSSWTQISCAANVTDGEASIEFRSDAPATKWIEVDDVYFG